ncbi:hypothetical protein RIF29_31872 [Crotalaria pallida]|uniref:Uncharacterized protein n=1 Tax=Crotalaria pallida TaxID=3830 RepID=A0AAN9EID0_CROPI
MVCYNSYPISLDKAERYCKLSLGLEAELLEQCSSESEQTTCGVLLQWSGGWTLGQERKCAVNYKQTLQHHLLPYHVSRFSCVLSSLLFSFHCVHTLSSSSSCFFFCLL